MFYIRFYKLLALLLNLTDVSSLPESRVKPLGAFSKDFLCRLRPA